jgi:phosphate transport system permease protein
MALVKSIGDNGAAKRVEDEIFRQGRDVRGVGLRVTLLAALVISTLILITLMFDVFVDGWPVINSRFGDFWSGTLRSRSEDEQLGISQGLAGSLWIAMIVALLAFPIGIAAAVYLEEYAPRNRLTNAIDIAIRNLAGVPSVVYGLLGLFLFVSTNDGQSTLLAGGVTLAILVLPIVVITAAEAIRAVPSSLKEGAYGVGATKWDVVRSQVLPFAAPGILTGTLLSLSRAVGEAAPLILVGAITGRLAPRSGSFVGLDQLLDRFTAMPIVIVGWVQESGRDDGFGAAAGAAIVVLLAFVILMNSGAVLLRNYFEKKRG